MMWRVLAVAWMLLMISSLSSAQPTLVLLNRNRVVTRFSEGERIRFDRKDRTHRNGLITGLETGFIILDYDDTTYLSQIRRIDLRRRSTTNFKVASAGTTLIVAGVALALMNLFYDNPTHELDPAYAKVSGAMIGTGLLLQFFNNNYFKLSRHRKAGVVR